MYYKKMKTNQSGMSLIEVLVSLTIVGVVTAALTSSIVSVMTAQKTIEARQNIISIVNDIQALTSNGSTCLNMMGAGTQVFDYNASRSALGYPVTVRLNNESLSAGAESRAYSVRVSRLYLTNGTAVGMDGTLSVFKARLMGEFQPLASATQFGGLSDFAPRSIASTFITVNSANRIISCLNQSPIESGVIRNYCEEMGGEYNETTRRCENLISTAQICSAVGGTMSGHNCQLPNTGGSSGGGYRWTFSPSNSPAIGTCNAHGQGGGSACLIGSPCTNQGEVCRYSAAFWTCHNVCQ